MANEALNDFVARVIEWAAYPFDPAMVASWVRMAENRLSESLRCQEMITFANAITFENKVRLPDDYEELDFVRDVNAGVLHYKPRDELYSLPICDRRGKYSLTGNYLLLGAPVDESTGVSLEITYFAAVPRLYTNPTWLLAKYEWLLLPAVVGYSEAFNVSDERAGQFSALVSSGIEQVNQNYMLKRGGGSTLTTSVRRKGF